MRSLLQRLLGGRIRRTPVACYLRENGPIAYQFDIFSAESRERADADARERADAMLSGELAWAWKAARGWTELTRVSLSAFLADLAAGDVLLVAVEGEGDIPVDLTDATVKGWIRTFCRLQPSPLAAVISASRERQLLFVQQHASDAVNRLLEAWGLDKQSAERKAYPRLGPGGLEAIGERL